MISVWLSPVHEAFLIKTWTLTLKMMCHDLQFSVQDSDMWYWCVIAILRVYISVIRFSCMSNVCSCWPTCVCVVRDVLRRFPSMVWRHVWCNRGEGNSKWGCKDLAGYFFTGNPAKFLEKMKDHYDFAKECFQSMWPGDTPAKIETSPVAFSDDNAQLRTEARVNTKLLVSYVVHMFQYTKRKAEYKNLAYTLLKGLFERVGELGVAINIPLFREDGASMGIRRVRISANPHIDPWGSDPGLRRFFTMTWTFDLQDSKKQWVNTPIAQPHVADFICFTLDTSDLLKKRNPELYNKKLMMQRCSLSLVKQLAQHLDFNAASLLGPLEHQERKKAKRSRKSRDWVWSKVAEAQGLLWDRCEIETWTCVQQIVALT